jgi:hypothetical protein
LNISSYSSHHHHHHVPKSSVGIVHQPHFNFNLVPGLTHPTTTTESTYFRPFLTKIPNEPSQNTNNLDVIQTCPSRRFSVPAMVAKSTSTAVTLIPKKRKNWDFQHFNNTKEIDNPGIDVQLQERDSVVKYAN